MRFTLDLLYGADPDTVAHAYADPALYEAFADLPRAGRPDVLEHTVKSDVIEMRVRWRFTATLSSAARAVIDPDRLTWVDVSTHDLARRRVAYRMVPDHYADRFSCSGAYRFDPTGTGTLRVIEGELRVKAPLVARAVERAIVSGLEEQMTSEVAVVDAFLS